MDFQQTLGGIIITLAASFDIADTIDYDVQLKTSSLRQV